MEKQKDLNGNPFFDATKEVFKSMLDLDITRIQGDKEAGREEAVRVTVGLTGDLSGTVVFRFPKSTTLNIVRTMSGMEAEQLDEFATSMLSEMANIISGNAVTALSEMNYRCDILPPQITIGSEDLRSGKMDMLLDSPAGNLQEHVALEPAI